MHFAVPGSSGKSIEDLIEIARRQREIARQIADEDFSLRAILTSMVEGVLIADGDMQIRLVNERLRQMFSLPKSPMDRTVMEVFQEPPCAPGNSSNRWTPGNRNRQSCKPRLGKEINFS